MADTGYIADSAGTNKVYFDYNPYPIPVPRYEVVGARKRTLNGRDGSSNITPGQWHYYPGGSHASGRTLELNFQWMGVLNYTNIMAKLTGTQMGVVQVSPDGFMTYNCIFAPGEVDAKVIEGTTLLEVTLRFYCVS